MQRQLRYVSWERVSARNRKDAVELGAQILGWINLSSGKRQELNSLFALNRKLFKAYVLKESLDRLWNYRYEGAMLNYLER